MSNLIVFMFSGQGSQYYHMGQEFFARQPVFRSWMLRLNDIVYEITGESVLNKLYDGQKTRSEVFSSILYTYPAIFMVEYALAQVCMETGIIPDYVLGTSMGEFAAAAIAGVMTVEEILKVLLEQANLIKACCPSGGMLAILHDSSLYSETAVINRNSELASINYNNHFVISGKTEELKEIEEFLRDKKIISQLLPVTYGFHSSLIDSAAIRYLDFLKGKIYHKPRIPLASCIQGRILTQLPNAYFWEVARKPIVFPEALKELEKQSSKNLVYLDLGPGGSLTSFAKRNINIDSQSEVYNIMSPFNQDIKNLNKIKDRLACRI
ncbi:Polyketide biosynthesis acyltransferase homolog PksD [Candidatus Desulfosporosinus infrequens]|uniref:Polyketide biosynthesis acyltransferase homolog PksD n=1 Tax=Candidatus Desulfosporosinus infrequens TaxID=2043169 RepID=A0A2U3LFN4_9FIRM|nr:Polyketide biosynthesis acyltransferase homolog PksD [Candidatus Desulfosporosinus infrequens]